MSTEPAVIFTTSTCTYCDQAKRYFDERGVAYIERNIQTDPDALAYFGTITEKRGVPVIELAGQVIEGFDRRRIDDILNGRELGNE